MERAGVDGFTVTTNIDLGVGGRQPLSSARAIRDWTRLPVAVCGGLRATDPSTIASPDWDILIVGRGVADAVEPADTCRRLVDLVHRPDEGDR